MNSSGGGGGCCPPPPAAPAGLPAGFFDATPVGEGAAAEPDDAAAAAAAADDPGTLRASISDLRPLRINADSKQPLDAPFHGRVRSQQTAQREQRRLARRRVVYVARRKGARGEAEADPLCLLRAPPFSRALEAYMYTSRLT